MDSIILFDFDGTIADTISVGLEIINSHADRFGYKRLDGELNTHLSAMQLVKLAEVKFWKLPYLVYKLKQLLSVLLSFCLYYAISHVLERDGPRRS